MAAGARLLATAAAAFLATAACIPLPIRNTVQVTPNATGRLVSASGRPVSGAPVALVASARDPGCTAPVARTLTDAEGHFTFAAVQEERSVLWLTMMESFGTAYYLLCAGDPGDSTTTARIEVYGHESGDELACVNWMFEGTPRVSCNSPSWPRWLTGGEWSTDSTQGIFRVIVERSDTSFGVGETYLQWIERDLDGTPIAVRETLRLTAGPKIWFDEVPTFSQTAGRWYLEGKGRKLSGWGGSPRLRFELGGPGTALKVPAAGS